MSTNKIKVGDKVQFTDNSYLLPTDYTEKYVPNFVQLKQVFTVVALMPYVSTKGYECTAHDVYVKADNTGRVYLHSLVYVMKVEEKKVKLTVEDIQHLLGYGIEVVA